MIYFLILASIVLLFLNFYTYTKINEFSKDNEINVEAIESFTKKSILTVVLNAILSFLLFSFMLYLLKICAVSGWILFVWLIVFSILKPSITMVLIAIVYSEVGGLPLLIILAIIRFFNHIVNFACKKATERLNSNLEHHCNLMDAEIAQCERIKADCNNTNNEFMPYN